MKHGRALYALMAQPLPQMFEAPPLRTLRALRPGTEEGICCFAVLGRFEENRSTNGRFWNRMIFYFKIDFSRIREANQRIHFRANPKNYPFQVLLRFLLVIRSS